MSGIGSFLAGIAGTVAKRALIGVGVGIVSFAAVSAALTSALGAAKTAWSGLAGDALALVQMAGVATAASILAGALIAAVSVTALKQFEVR